MPEVPSPDDRMPWRPPWQTTPRRAPWARALRILFGAVAFFGGLAFLYVEVRGAPADERPKGALQDLLILALAVFVALIAAYGFDQLLTGVWPSRRRWFQRAEDVLGKRLRGARRSGNLTVGYVWNAPVRVHWSVLIGLVLFGGFRPGAWIGFLVVILAHELGHAVLVRRSGLRVVAVSLHAFGGECQWLGQPTSLPVERGHGGVQLVAGCTIGRRRGLAVLFPASARRVARAGLGPGPSACAVGDGPCETESAIAGCGGGGRAVTPDYPGHAAIAAAQSGSVGTIASRMKPSPAGPKNVPGATRMPRAASFAAYPSLLSPAGTRAQR